MEVDSLMIHQDLFDNLKVKLIFILIMLTKSYYLNRSLNFKFHFLRTSVFSFSYSYDKALFEIWKAKLLSNPTNY